MQKAFEDYLANAQGKVRRVNLNDVFTRRQNISTYYWNCASDLHSGAQIIGYVLENKECKITPELLGLGSGFSFGASLIPVFRLLAGFSLELLLKAIAKILDRPHLTHHKLNQLRENVGITLNEHHIAILNALTEEIEWSSRYPTPKQNNAWEKAISIFENLRKKEPLGKTTLSISTHWSERAINLENYDAIWAELSPLYWRAQEEIYEG